MINDVPSIDMGTVHNEKVNTGIQDRCNLDDQIKGRFAISVFNRTEVIPGAATLGGKLVLRQKVFLTNRAD